MHVLFSIVLFFLVPVGRLVLERRARLTGVVGLYMSALFRLRAQLRAYWAEVA